MVISYQKVSGLAGGFRRYTIRRSVACLSEPEVGLQADFSLLISQYLERGVVAWGFERYAWDIWGMDAVKVSRTSPRLEKTQLTGADY